MAKGLAFICDKSIIFSPPINLTQKYFCVQLRIRSLRTHEHTHIRTEHSSDFIDELFAEDTRADYYNVLFLSWT